MILSAVADPWGEEYLGAKFIKEVSRFSYGEKDLDAKHTNAVLKICSKILEESKENIETVKAAISSLSACLKAYDKKYDIHNLLKK